MRARPALFRIGLAALGYLVAVTVAVVVTVALMLTSPMIRSTLASGSPPTLAGGLAAAFVVGFFWTFLCALPGFVVAVMVGEGRRWRGWVRYALAGAANVVPSFVIFTALAGSPLTLPAMMAASFPGGFVGGAAYWLAVGRVIAARRRAPAQPAAT